MATYYNLASFENCQVGDVIEYSSNIVINFAGCKVKVELYGYSGTSSSSTGGYTTFELNTALLPSTTLTYFLDGGSSLSYQASTTYDAYYRIGVAGNSGYGTSSSSYTANRNGGQGGGLTAGSGSTSTYTSGSTYISAAGGGTHTSGGAGAVARKTGTVVSTAYSGSFGTGGSARRDGSTYSGYQYGGNGGDGWYGGGGGGAYTDGGNNPRSTSGGGGSGFVIGQSTTIYPSGYLGSNSSLITTIESAVSNATLTKGGAPTNQTAKMVVTILELASTSTPSINYFNGTNFVPCEVYYYNGTSFVLCKSYYYNGTGFQELGV